MTTTARAQPERRAPRATMLDNTADLNDPDIAVEVLLMQPTADALAGRPYA